MNVGDVFIGGGIIVAVVLGTTYIIEVGVATLHPKSERRSDAMKALRIHRFTKTSARHWWWRRRK